MGPARTTLKDHFTHALPHGVELDFFHLSTPPTLCPALFAPPPGQKPIKTYCEEHFLNVTHAPKSANSAHSRRIAIFALEIYLYTTDTLTTVFVSKADSTGYAHLLSLPPGYRSILKTLASVFVEFLVASRWRKGRKLNVSLFARAQDQYLFPGSVEHGRKHVLSDRSLVKWWCNTLDPIARAYPHPNEPDAALASSAPMTSRAYLLVPGHDKYETSSFFPLSARTDPVELKRWTNGHPLNQITSYPLAAPRSIVPHFPDDPKSRFLLDLDEELANAAPAGNRENQPSPSKRGTGQWASVRTLEQFWEMMAYRQECSSGRLVGFLWIMFNPKSQSVDDAGAPPSPSLRPAKRKHSEFKEESKPLKQKKPKRRKKILKGLIKIRLPRVKTAGTALKASKLPVEKAKAWYWPVRTRGSIIVSEKAYERIIKILQRLDFATFEAASTSTEKWIHETAVMSGVAANWGVHVVGDAARPAISSTPKDAASLPTPQSSAPASQSQAPATSGQVNTLNLGLVRKRAKPDQEAEHPGNREPGGGHVNDLGAGLVRKKAKR